MRWISSWLPELIIKKHIKIGKRKELKKESREEITPMAWHPNRW